MNRSTVRKLYIDFYNNFLTDGAFADYYMLDDATAERVLNIGRKLCYR